MMTAKEFYNKKALKHQLNRAIKYDKQSFEDAIIELMEDYAQEKKAFQPSFEKEVVICDRCGREGHVYIKNLCVNCMDADRES